ncbi:uncharacterized protein LOC116847632 isoform X2 [Odontomachus brunneus]|uniref:uncharacterized protein LOC116847632 isoform X2 n=1 Tax=Odontomachus brunneus TaxID=486640 RepID=UPI0013F22089|nr:uncharacterized protein LOC116847632 isoform X2 [Odontomachus brunneus]XP_032678695.1 uncharacterized protein LOC116847632 isoform X2 [Odontomachus brunneus]
MNGMNGNVPKMSDKSSSPDCGEDQKLLPPTTPTTPMILQVTKNPYSSFRYRSRYRAGPTRKLRRRAVLKNGDCNVLQSRISRRSLRFLQDIFTTLVDTQWRWTLLCFILSFFLSWLGFAVIWWLIAFTHGDFEESHLPPFQVENNWTPCVYNIFSFTSCFLFSIETQHTIGYGSRSTTEECPEAIFVMCIQSIAGVMIQAFMVGIVFAKMTRPKQRTQTLLFSRNAVICQRDGELCLMFRVGDMRKSHIIGASVRAQVIRNRTTKEGEILSQNQQELVVGTDGQNGDLFFIWPTTIIHRINEESPFYNMSAEDMLTDRFEVVLILEGTIESTGQTTQARSSYLPQEILWGHRFDPMVSYSKERQGYEVDYSLFDSTTQVDTPLCSGKELAEFYKVQDDLRHGTGVPIDEDLMERQCWCQPINQRRFKVSLAPLDTPKSHGSIEDEQRWPNAGRVQPSLNNIPHGPQMENVESPRVFDFDPNAIQVMDDMEFEHLPEAVNQEILKNSQEIVFEDEEGVSRRGPIKLYEERSKTLRSSRKIILEEERENIQGPLERNRLNVRNTSKIYKEEKLPLMKVEENHEDVRNILQIPGRRCKIKNNKNHKMYLERELRIQDQRCHVVPVNQDQKTDIFLNEEQKSLRKLNRNRRDESVISNGRFFEESERNAIGQLTFSLNRDQENPKTDLFPNKKPAMDLSTHLIDDSFATNDRVLFKESKRNAINTRDYEICLEKRLEMHDPLLNKKQDDEEVFEQPKRNAINNMKYIKMLEEGYKTLRESLTLNQRSNPDISERENDHWVKRYDKIRIESEKRRPASRLAKIIIQRKYHPADFRSLVSPFSDLSPESGFYEGNLSNLSPECGRTKPHLLPRNRFEDVDEVKGDSSSSENNLSQKSVFGDVRIPEECVQVPIVAVSRHVCDNIQIVDESRTSSRSNLSRKRFINEDDISVKCAKSRIIDISSHTGNSIENVAENRASSDSNLSHKHFFDEDHSTLKYIEVPFNYIDNSIHDIKHRVSSDSDLSSKRFVDDDNNLEERLEDLDTRLSKNDQRFVENDSDVIKCANVAVSGERITCTDNDLQHINETMTKRSFSNVSRKLFNDFDDSNEQNCYLMLAKTNHKL